MTNSVGKFRCQRGRACTACWTMQAASIKYGRLCFYVSLGSTTDLILCLKYREILWVQRITKINITNKGFSTLQCFLLLWFVSLVVPVLFPSVPLFSTVVLSVAIDFRWFLFVCLFVLFVCLSVCLFVCLFVRSFVCLFVCLFVHYFMLNITVTQHSTAQYTESTVLPHCWFGSSNSNGRCETLCDCLERNWSWSLLRCLVDLKVNLKLRISLVSHVLPRVSRVCLSPLRF